MKKLILGLALTAGTFAFAQQTGNTSSNPVTFGVKGGMNVSSLSKDSGLDDQKSKIGFNAGVFANIPLAASFSVQPEVQYSQYGNKSNYTLGNTKFSASTKLDYITVPVMFQYNLIPNLYVEAGPEFGFMVSAKNKFKNESNGDSNTTDNYKDNLNTFNFGIGLGAGYYFTPNLGLTARYVAGLTDVAKNRPSGSDATRNNLFQVGLAYKFK
ncbi:porin family protein [Chryseobacterium sp. ES2]|uniref:Porin family protein n=1 Tax=Chryseobacterium metallicongregator TaxID=3073042 RepID=A0ABU1E920_9FLAO|nr:MULTISPECIES: porin family protein [Chryseobacterium]MCP1297878.1 PorT family protein [Chryseobacterium sp. S0630]MDR4954172.1 porin family protein [Chryseobacterium sp. ES2]